MNETTTADTMLTTTVHNDVPAETWTTLVSNGGRTTSVGSNALSSGQFLSFRQSSFSLFRSYSWSTKARILALTPTCVNFVHATNSVNHALRATPPTNDHNDSRPIFASHVDNDMIKDV